MRAQGESGAPRAAALQIFRAVSKTRNDPRRRIPLAGRAAAATCDEAEARKTGTETEIRDTGYHTAGHVVSVSRVKAAYEHFQTHSQPPHQTLANGTQMAAAEAQMFSWEELKSYVSDIISMYESTDKEYKTLSGLKQLKADIHALTNSAELDVKRLLVGG